MNNQARLFFIGCSLMLPLIGMVPVLADAAETADALSHTQAKSEAQAQAEKRVNELVSCLAGELTGKGSQVSAEYLKKQLKKDTTQMAEDCMADRTERYAAHDFASYAMGVSLQDKLLGQYESLNWVDFINGLLRADSSTVRVTDSSIATAVGRTLLGDAEASQQYLDQVAESKGVKEVQGVFIRTLPGTDEDDGLERVNGTLGSAGSVASEHSQAAVSVLAFRKKDLCNLVGKTNERQKLIKFYQVKPIDGDIDDDIIVNSRISCIAYEPDNVIRGWRLAMNELEASEIYDVLIPSELAYGATGVPGMVEADENLRFLMQVIE